MPTVTAPVVVILAAGEGTRMRSVTPKLLHPLCGRPMIAWPVAAARGAGAARVVVVDGPAGRLEDVLDPGVSMATQARPLGTADAVKAAAPEIAADSTVIVLSGDVPLITPETIRALAEAHERAGVAATMATMTLDDPAGYGRVVRAADGSVERVVETKAPGDATARELEIREVNTGIYAFTGGPLLAALEQVRAENAQGEQYLPDVLPILRTRGLGVAAHEIADPGETLGINDRIGLAAVRARAQRRIHERHMLAGVTIVDPASTVIDADVELGQDAVIAPFSSLHGATVVASGARIGPLSTLIDARVGEDASIVHSYVCGASIGARVSVGPFAYLRPGAVLREDAKAGTFVEIKNSDIGERTKVPHLSYIGDAEIGADTNVAAGNITVNFPHQPGSSKGRTKIGRNVRTGVHNAFVAPLEIGDDAWVAVGTVVTDDVPPGSLAGFAPRQVTKEGYVYDKQGQPENADD